MEGQPMKTTEKRNGVFYVLFVLSLLLFGTNGLYVSRISLSGSHIVLFRTLIGGPLLTLLVFLRGGFDREAVKADFPALLLGGVALGLNWVALFSAYRLLNVSLATLIYYAGPMLVILFSPVLFREKLSGRKLAAILPVALGLILISGSIAAGGLRRPRPCSMPRSSCSTSASAGQADCRPRRSSWTPPSRSCCSTSS